MYLYPKCICCLNCMGFSNVNRQKQCLCQDSEAVTTNNGMNCIRTAIFPWYYVFTHWPSNFSPTLSKTHPTFHRFIQTLTDPPNLSWTDSIILFPSSLKKYIILDRNWGSSQIVWWRNSLLWWVELWVASCLRL